MSSKTAVKLYTTAIAILLMISTVFLINDIRHGTLFRDRLHFSQGSFFKDKKSCDVSKDSDCIPNPLTLWKTMTNAKAAEKAQQDGASTEEASKKPQPRFTNE